MYNVARQKNCANVIFFDGASYRPSASKSNFGGGGFFFRGGWLVAIKNWKMYWTFFLFWWWGTMGWNRMGKREKGSRWRGEKNLITFASFWNKEYKWIIIKNKMYERRVVAFIFALVFFAMGLTSIVVFL